MFPPPSPTTCLEVIATIWFILQWHLFEVTKAKARFCSHFIDAFPSSGIAEIDPYCWLLQFHGIPFLWPEFAFDSRIMMAEGYRKVP